MITELPQMPKLWKKSDPEFLQLWKNDTTSYDYKYIQYKKNPLKIKDEDDNFINLLQEYYLDLSYHPRNRLCREKLMFNFDDLFDETSSFTHQFKYW